MNIINSLNFNFGNFFVLKCSTGSTQTDQIESESFSDVLTQWGTFNQNKKLSNLFQNVKTDADLLKTVQDSNDFKSSYKFSAVLSLTEGKYNFCDYTIVVIKTNNQYTYTVSKGTTIDAKSDFDSFLLKNKISIEYIDSFQIKYKIEKISFLNTPLLNIGEFQITVLYAAIVVFVIILVILYFLKVFHRLVFLVIKDKKMKEYNTDKDLACALFINGIKSNLFSSLEEFEQAKKDNSEKYKNAKEGKTNPINKMIVGGIVAAVLAAASAAYFFLFLQNKVEE